MPESQPAAPLTHAPYRPLVMRRAQMDALGGGQQAVATPPPALTPAAPASAAPTGGSEVKGKVSVLRLRAEQMTVLGRAARAEFVMQSANQLRGAFPRQTQGVSFRRLLRLVEDWTAQAEAGGIELAEDVRTFIECQAVLGRVRDPKRSVPWLAGVLGRADLDGTAKVDLIDEHMTFGNRAGA